MSDIFLTYWFCHVTLMWKVKLWYTQPLIQMSVVCNFMTRRSRKSHLLPFLKLISRGSDGREEKVGQEKVERPSTASSKDFILCPPFSKKGKINFFIEFFFVETTTWNKHNRVKRGLRDLLKDRIFMSDTEIRKIGKTFHDTRIKPITVMNTNLQQIRMNLFSDKI